MRNHSILLLYKLLPVSVGPFFTKISFGATVSQQTEDDFYHSHWQAILHFIAFKVKFLLSW